MRSATVLTLALLCASCGPSQPKYDAATEDCIHRHRKMEENAMQGASEAQKETIRKIIADQCYKGTRAVEGAE